MGVGWTIFIFLLGLLVGSFLNLVIDRLPRGEQILKGRSKCDSCGRVLAWYDLIPLVSWLILLGRCRYCHSPIPLRNVVVELATVTLFLLTVFFFWEQNSKFQIPNSKLFDFSYNLEVVLALFIISFLIAIFFIDLEQKIIPDKIVYPAILITLVFLLISHTPEYGKWGGWLNYLFSAVGAMMFFLVLVLLTRGKGMGVGDVKLAFLMGLFLGFPKIIYALYFAFLTGAFLSVMLILLGRKKFGQTIAFGPFLVLGTLLAYFNVLNFIGGKIW